MSTGTVDGTGRVVFDVARDLGGAAAATIGGAELLAVASASTSKAAKPKATRPKAAASAATAPSSRTRVVARGAAQVKLPSTGYAKATTAAKASGTTAAKSAIDDKTLAVEERLLLLLAQQKKEASSEIESLLAKAQAKSKSATKKSSTVLDVAKAALPALGIADKFLGGKLEVLLKQVSGPMAAAAAAALGLPALSPLALDLVPKVLDAVLDARVAGASGGTSGTSGGASKGGKLDEVDAARIQLLQNRVQEWTTLISNLMRSFHDTRMSVVHNLR